MRGSGEIWSCKIAKECWETSGARVHAQITLEIPYGETEEVVQGLREVKNLVALSEGLLAYLNKMTRGRPTQLAPVVGGVTPNQHSKPCEALKGKTTLPSKQMKFGPLPLVGEGSTEGRVLKLKPIFPCMPLKDSEERLQLPRDLEQMGCQGFMEVPWNYPGSNQIVMEVSKEVEIDPKWAKSLRGKL